MNEPVEDNTPEESKPGKKQYTPPVLIEWGTLGELTQSAGWSGKSDGGRFLFSKTR